MDNYEIKGDHPQGHNGQTNGGYMGGHPPPLVYPNQVVVTHPLTAQEPDIPFSWCHLVMGVISIFCCSIFGFVATIMSLLSYTDHRVKDFAKYRNKRSCALGFGIAAIVIGSLIFIGVIIMYAVVINAAKSSQSHYNWN